MLYYNIYSGTLQYGKPIHSRDEFITKSCLRSYHYNTQTF